MAKVPINPKILIWGIERSGKLGAELESKFPKLQAWISGAEMPSYNQLEALAKTIYLPFGYFFLSAPPEEVFPIPFYKTTLESETTKPSINLFNTVQEVQRRQIWYSEYLIEQDSEKFPFVGSAQIGDNPKAIANDIRSVLGLSENWAATHATWAEAYRALRNSIDDKGINVVANRVVGNNSHRQLSVQEFRGFVIVDDYAPFIFINNFDSKAIQIFSLVFGLAHVWFGRSAVYDLRLLMPADNELEKACYLVAAEFLIPEDKINEVISKLKSSVDIYETIAQTFKVSTLIAARRCLDIGVISHNEFIDFFNTYLYDESQKESKLQSGNFYAAQNIKLGRRFALAVIQAVQSGYLLYSDAYRLTGLNGNAFDELVKRITLATSE